MTDEMIALSRRAVACKGWRWMPGMRAVGRYPYPPVRVHAYGENLRDTDDMEEPEPWGWQQAEPYGDHVYPGPYLPDLTDPATLGCMFALVREAWSDPTLCVVLDTSDGRWHVGCWDDGMAMRGSGGATEAEALVSALESAP